MRRYAELWVEVFHTILLQDNNAAPSVDSAETQCQQGVLLDCSHFKHYILFLVWDQCKVISEGRRQSAGFGQVSFHSSLWVTHGQSAEGGPDLGLGTVHHSLSTHVGVLPLSEWNVGLLDYLR